MKIENCKLKNSGFSLIEVIISIFIVGVILFMLQAIAQSSVLVRTAKNQGIALAIARNEIESLRANGYDALPPSGTFFDILVDTLPPQATTTREVSTYNEKTKRVTVSVIWKDLGLAASSTLSLSTLITETGGLP